MRLAFVTALWADSLYGSVASVEAFSFGVARCRPSAHVLYHNCTFARVVRPFAGMAIRAAWHVSANAEAAAYVERLPETVLSAAQALRARGPGRLRAKQEMCL